MALKVTHTESNRGRPKLDMEALMLKVYNEAPKGLNNQQLADFLGIHIASFCDLKNEYVEFNEAIKYYTGVSTIEVLQSFKKLAVGYTAQEETRELKKDGKEFKMMLTKTVTKHFQPSAVAGQFYLKNKMPEVFKDKTETVLTPGAGMESITFKAKRRETNE